MSNIALAQQSSAIPALMMDEQELAHVLQTSLYPGAAMPSIKMVMAYCRASQLDPMQKPVHIVPMWDKNSKSTRDVIMPGVGLYRTQAARSGEYAGMSEPEFGPDVTEKIGGVEMTYPKFCKVIVRRLLPNGIIVDFPAVEYWRENYATAGKDSDAPNAPNAMWKKRPYGQIAKCAEAQALRKAFPEIGSQPTAEEMEGKEFGAQPEQAPTQPAEVILPDYSEDQMKSNLNGWQEKINNGKSSPEHIIAMISSRYTLSPAQQAVIRSIKPHAAESQPGEHADFVEALTKGALL